MDTSHVLVLPGTKTPTATVIVDGAGERLVVSEDDHALPMSSGLLPPRSHRVCQRWCWLI